MKAVHPAWSIFRPAHLHMNLLGYHIIPRLAGKPLHDRRLAMVHLWLANIGLLLFAPGLMLRAVAHPAASATLAIGAALSALGAYAFAGQVWLTLRENSAIATRTLRVLDSYWTGMCSLQSWEPTRAITQRLPPAGWLPTAASTSWSTPRPPRCK